MARHQWDAGQVGMRTSSSRVDTSRPLREVETNVGSRYVLITACRDESDFAATTIDSVLQQSVPPSLWVIVDDGSTDRTPEILADYARRVDFIRVIRREDRGARAVGPGVIEAFYAGCDTVDLGEFEYVCKFDLDLDIPPTYFGDLIERMEQNPRIGSCSGKPYYRDPSSGTLVSEMIGDEMSVGMTKFYRVECFREIGGFVRQVMWDGIDAHRCRMLGWICVSWDDPKLRFVHLRPMGASHRGLLRGRVRWGFGQYFMGTGMLWILVSSLYRMTRRPLVLGGLAMLWGYLTSMVKRLPRFEDAEFRRFLRRYHRRCVVFGKAEATRRTDMEQKRVWESRHATENEPAIKS